MRRLITLVLFVVISSSCNRSSNKSEVHQVESEAIVMAPPGETATTDAVGEEEMNDVSNTSIVLDTTKKVIKTGEIRFETRDVKETRKIIVTATRKLKGYVSEETESGYEDGRKNYTLTLKVPAHNFDALLQAISSAADRIDSKNIQIQDITKEFIDTKTRLQNKKQLEKRYLELLGKASKISDMLAIENKLSEIRSEIESVEGQFLHMQKQVAYSSLSITFYSKSIEQETGKGFFYKVKTSLINGLEFIQLFFFGLLSVWPLLIVAALVYLWVIRWRRKRALKS